MLSNVASERVRGLNFNFNTLTLESPNLRN
jgi:hypothetical protein